VSAPSAGSPQSTTSSGPGCVPEMAGPWRGTAHCVLVQRGMECGALSASELDSRRVVLVLSNGWEKNKPESRARYIQLDDAPGTRLRSDARTSGDRAGERAQAHRAMGGLLAIFAAF
jgi:hypothetical protein